MHLTGKYQDWYEGERIPNSGHVYWCLGIDLDSTARVLQKALLGTEDFRITEELGTGSIPREDILMENYIKNGPLVKSIKIRHVDGGINTLQFFASAQKQGKLMGAVVKAAWLDEESEHNFIDIYQQVATRTTTTDGLMVITCTPEAGYTAFQQMFEENKDGKLYVQSATWYECPHLSPERIEEMLAKIHPSQREMRSLGIPILGSGAVFPFLDADVMCPDLTPEPHWQVLAGLDFSGVVDASVIAYAAYNPDNDTYYLYRLTYIDDIINKNPAYMSQCIRESETPNIPCISPHDGGINSANPESKAKIMLSLGTNILREPFRNGVQLSLSYKDHKNKKREPGLEFMRQLAREGRLKICRSCVQFFTEKAALFYKPKAGGGLETCGKDDAIDATRYAIVSLLDNRGLPYGQLLGATTENWNNGFYNDPEFSIMPDEDDDDGYY